MIKLKAAPFPKGDESRPCTSADPELFFPQPHANPQQYVEAKALCNDCPIRIDCLIYALTVKVPGIWGGTSEHERIRIRTGLGVTAAVITASPAQEVREQIDALDDGTRSANEIALATGCDPKTVERRRTARQKGQAA